MCPLSQRIFLQMRNGRENMVVIYLIFGAVRRFLIFGNLGVGGK